MAARHSIEVVYALPERQVVIALKSAPGTTVREAIEQAGIVRQFPQIDLQRWGVGIFGKTRGLDEALQDGDRIEIYRPLLNDPKERRRRRAAAGR